MLYETEITNLIFLSFNNHPVYPLFRQDVDLVVSVDAAAAAASRHLRVRCSSKRVTRVRYY